MCACRSAKAGIDSNTVERSIRGLALTRKNALFAGHDRGAAGWAMIASLLETCKLNQVDPLAWTTDVLTKLVNRWPASRINELMPWAYAAKSASTAVNVGSLARLQSCGREASLRGLEAPRWSLSMLDRQRPDCVTRPTAICRQRKVYDRGGPSAVGHY
jgi:hypothetical protein